MKLRLRFLVMVVGALLFLPVMPTPSLYAQDTGGYWPTNGWRTSSPEAQGMDSGRLASMFAYIEEHDISVHSVLVIRHGYLVTEAYRYPYQPDTLHSLQSCTKSVVSALVGIAIQQGYIDGVDQHLIDLFPQRTIAHLDEAKRALTLEDVLTMRSGLPMFENVPPEVWESEQLVPAILDLPMATEPGGKFVYNGTASELLGAIVGETAGMKTLDFATQNLFEPLGIRDVQWDTYGPEHVYANAGLWLTPRDMAKFGYLYLKNGQWEGTQLLPPDWVTASTAAHVRHPGLGSQPFADGYGYQWWVDDDGYYMALGAGGQAILVHPDLDLIAVFTSGLKLDDDGLPVGLFDSFIIPAAQARPSLPENQEKSAELETRVQALAQPEPTPVPPLPATADRISDQVYSFEDNDLGWTSLTLRFDPGASEAIIMLNDAEMHIGLDGVVRTGNDQPLLKGRWIGDDRFQIDWEYLGSPYPMQVLLRFEAAAVSVRVWYHGYEESSWRFSGVAAEPID
jgi:CubicO group peptidase (beta-lactamase class C family)